MCFACRARVVFLDVIILIFGHNQKQNISQFLAYVVFIGIGLSIFPSAEILSSDSWNVFGKVRIVHS
jgi:hypothetical protein